MALELWDVVTEQGLLWECQELPGFPSLLLQTIEALRAGSARQAAGLRLPDHCRAIDFLFVGGGGASRPGLAETLRHGALAFCMDTHGEFVGEPGGFHLLRQAGLDGVVVDVGQTAIKVSTGSRRVVVPRCLDRLPLASISGAVEPARQALRAFVAGAIGQALDSDPAGIVLALPCELDEDNVPGPCSYHGLAGDATFVADVLRLAGLEESIALVLNDAELAAASARIHPGVPPDRTTLVLTLGFGVGAALLLPGESHVL